MTFIERLEQLRQEKGITRKKLPEDCSAAIVEAL